MKADGFIEFLAEKEMKKERRPEPLPETVPYYDHDFSVHPDHLRVSFADGSTAVYDLRTDQPHPVIVENIKIIRKWKQGYVNQPARRRKRR